MSESTPTEPSAWACWSRADTIKAVFVLVLGAYIVVQEASEWVGGPNGGLEAGAPPPSAEEAVRRPGLALPVGHEDWLSPGPGDGPPCEVRRAAPSRTASTRLALAAYEPPRSRPVAIDECSSVRPAAPVGPEHRRVGDPAH